MLQQHTFVRIFSFVIIFVLTTTISAGAQDHVVIDFSDADAWDGGTMTGYNFKTYTEDGWTFSDGDAVREASDAARRIGAYSWRLRGQDADNPWIAINTEEGIYTGFEIELRPWSTSEPSASNSYTLSVSTDGGENWTVVQEDIMGVDPLDWFSISHTFDETEFDEGEFQIMIARQGALSGNARLNIGRFTAFAPLGEDPLLLSSTETLSGFFYGEGDGPSEAQSFQVSGANLNGSDVTVTAPANFEISESESGTYSGSVTLQNFDGTETDIWVRMSEGLAIGEYDGDILISGGGADDVMVALAGSVGESIFLIYEFTGNTVTPAQKPADAVASDFQISSGSVGFGTTGTWAGSGTPYAEGSGGWSAGSPGDAKYFFFTINPDEGLAAELDNISFEWRTTGAGPSAITVEINGVHVATFNSGSNEQDIFDQPLAEFSNLTPVEVKIKGWNDGSRTTSGGGAFRINDVRLDGSIVPFVTPSVPNPVVSPDAGTYFESQFVFIDNITDYSETAEIYYTLDGEDPDEFSDTYDIEAGIFLEDGFGPVTLKVIAIDGEEQSDIITAVYTFPIDVADIAELRDQNTGSTIFRVANEVTLTGQTNFRNTKFFQDGSGAGIQIDDAPSGNFNPGVITTEYEVGDNVASISGTLGIFGGQLQFTPAVDPGEPVSSGNIIEPVARTLDELTSTDQSMLVIVENVEFEDGDGEAEFGGGGSMTNITDPGIEGFTFIYRNIFGDSDITGSIIPDTPVTLVGIVQEIGSGLTLGARNLNDIDPIDKTVMLTGVEGYRMLSSPANATYGELLAPVWTQSIPNSNDPEASHGPNVWTWNNASSNANASNWIPVPDLNDDIAPGTGILAYIFEDDDPYMEGVTGGFPKTLTVSGKGHAETIAPAVNANPDAWTLLGNPFFSAIRFANLVRDNLTDVIYIWDANDDEGDVEFDPEEANMGAGSWKSYSLTAGTGDITDGVISAFQGFFVQNTEDGNGELAFPASAKTTGGTFLGKEKRQDVVRIELEGQGMRNSLWLAFRDDGSMDPVPGDAHHLAPLSRHHASLAGRKADRLFDISIVPGPDEAFQLPVHADATLEGSYKLTVTDMQVSFDSPLYLTDRLTSTKMELVEGMVYEFTLTPHKQKPIANAGEMLENGLQKVVADSERDRFVITSENPLNTEISRELPGEFTLDQNYPNPFNPGTVITYSVPEQSHIRLSVYDVLGREVSVLVNEQQAPGRYQVSWDAGNLSSGVYMYRLEAPGMVITRQMTLVK